MGRDPSRTWKKRSCTRKTLFPGVESGIVWHTKKSSPAPRKKSRQKGTPTKLRRSSRIIKSHNTNGGGISRRRSRRKSRKSRRKRNRR